MPLNTNFDPPNSLAFEKSKLMKNCVGVSETFSAGTTGTLDLNLTEDHLVMGGTLLVIGAEKGDKVDFQILFGDAVVAQFISDWYVDPTNTVQPSPPTPYPAKLRGGFKIRLVYHSTGQNDVWAALNLNLEKILE